MKSFDQIRKRPDLQQLELEERFSRVSIGASFALQGKRYGDKAERALSERSKISRATV